MSKPIVRRAARDDVTELAARIALDKIEPALCFLEEAEKAFEFLAQHPHAGPRVDPPVSKSPHLRFWPIKHFRKYLVIYLPLVGGAEIVRVLHGARDLASALRDV